MPPRVRIEARTEVALRDAFAVSDPVPSAGVPIERSTVARTMGDVAVLGPHTSALDLVDPVDLVDEPIPGALHGPRTEANPRRLGREGTCRSPT